MSRLFALWLAIGALAALPALAENPTRMPANDRWEPHVTVGTLERVTLRVHWYDTKAELRSAANERNIAPRSLHGFSVLSRNRETGEYVCDVFVVRLRGSLVDNDSTVSFGHEALHCLGFAHR